MLCVLPCSNFGVFKGFITLCGLESADQGQFSRQICSPEVKQNICLDILEFSNVLEHQFELFCLPQKNPDDLFLKSPLKIRQYKNQTVSTAV